jgi:hypothetical protein
MSAASELLSQLRRDGFSVLPDGDRVLIEPASKLTEELRATIRANKPALLKALSTLERRRARVIRELQENAELRVAFDALNTPLKPGAGEPVSIVFAIRSPTHGIVSAEFSVPRERFDLVMFGQMLDETTGKPS